VKPRGSCMVDTFLVTTEEWMKASECDILHQTTERERERVPQHRNTFGIRTMQPEYNPLASTNILTVNV